VTIKAICSHCEKLVLLQEDGTTIPHDHPVPCRQICKGAKKPPKQQEHRWSGWPGAMCLDCGAEDKREICVSVHEWDPEKGTTCTREECQNGYCPYPGAALFDAYRRNIEVKKEET